MLGPYHLILRKAMACRTPEAKVTVYWGATRTSTKKGTYSRSAMVVTHGLPLGSADTADFETICSFIRMHYIVNEEGQPPALCEQCVAPRISRIHILLQIM